MFDYHNSFFHTEGCDGCFWKTIHSAVEMAFLLLAAFVDFAMEYPEVVKFSTSHTVQWDLGIYLMLKLGKVICSNL